MAGKKKIYLECWQHHVELSSSRVAERNESNQLRDIAKLQRSGCRFSLQIKGRDSAWGFHVRYKEHNHELDTTLNAESSVQGRNLPRGSDLRQVAECCILAGSTPNVVLSTLQEFAAAKQLPFNVTLTNIVCLQRSVRRRSENMTPLQVRNEFYHSHFD